MPLDRQQVFAAIANHQKDLRDLGVRKLQLFGSTARNESVAQSDLDFLVELEENTLDSYMGVKLLLEDLFGRSVDLVLHDTIKPRIRDRILQEAVHAPGF